VNRRPAPAAVAPALPVALPPVAVLLATLLLVTLLLAACSSPASSPPPPGGWAAAPSTPALAPGGPVFAVATATGPSVAVFDSPAGSEPSRSLASPQPDGSTLVLLVQDQRPGWFQVLLPVRPNGMTGWIRAADVTVATHDFRIDVEVGTHTLTVWKGSQVFLTDTVSVGSPATPTALGRFYTTGLFETARTQPVYGPYAYPLSGWSEVLFDFDGGEGQMGIHGTDDPSSLGRSVSNGCVRMSNEAITRLATVLPVGVPVDIRA
jgi:lipoprotein-anchoring transpeptidase ErfK/SrfK